MYKRQFFGGKVIDDNDIFAIVDSGLDFWLTAGRFADLFEFKFAKYLGVRDARLVNSGSSANLVAVSVLTSPTLGERQLLPGDEAVSYTHLTTACCLRPAHQGWRR